MNQKQFKSLKRGDIIRQNNSGDSYVVDANYINYVIAIRSAHVSNPSEWQLCYYNKIEKGDNNDNEKQ